MRTTKDLETVAVTQHTPTDHGANHTSIVTIEQALSFIPAVDLTIAAVHGQIFKSHDRFDSKGRKIAGNGLAKTGAIIRRGRKVLIDVEKYAVWLTSGVTA